MNTTLPIIAQALQSDASALASLRVEAMRPCLESVGRFDPQRARNRFLQRFQPDQTWKLIRDEDLAGFFVLQQHLDHLYLDHLYVAPAFQGSGLGALVLDHIKSLALPLGLPIRLMALRDSPANRFYQAHGFRKTGETELDNFYEWCADSTRPGSSSKSDHT